MEKDEFLREQKRLIEEAAAAGTELQINGAMTPDVIACMAVQMQQIMKAAVNAENLTGDPLWDEYLSILQAVRDQTELAYNSLREKADSPLVINVDEIMTLKILMAVARERMTVLDLMMQIPSDLKKRGEATKEMFSKLPAISDGKKKRGLFG